MNRLNKRHRRVGLAQLEFGQLMLAILMLFLALIAAQASADAVQSEAAAQHEYLSS